jgi:hypothetical protein
MWKHDDRGRIYRTIRYAVTPSTGAVGNSLTDNTWFDAAGNVLKSFPSGSKLFTKFVYDSLGRRTAQHQGYDLDETSYADANDLIGDTILEQSETAYDDASNVIQSTTRMCGVHCVLRVPCNTVYCLKKDVCVFDYYEHGMFLKVCHYICLKSGTMFFVAVGTNVPCPPIIPRP